MGAFSIWHWVIVLVIILLLFGKNKIPTLMGDMAKGIKAFKSGMKEEPTASPKQIDETDSDGAAETVERHRLIGGAIARQQLDILHGQKQAVVAVIYDAQTIMRRIVDVERYQPVIAPNAMIGMNHQIALR